MSAAARPTRFTLADFFAWEATQECRHEFVDGEVYAMADGSNVHAHIAANLLVALRRQVYPRGCVVFQADAQLQAGENIFYPDIMAVCGPGALDGNQVRQPVLIAEVLSPSTESYDRGMKRRCYQERLPGLQTYVIVAQDAVLVEVLRRTAQGWTSELYTRADEAFELSDPPCRLTVAEIYDGVLDRIGDGRREM